MPIFSSLIKKFFLSREDFLLVFLFGSYARGLSTDESDVDIAILFKQPPDFYGVNEIKGQLSGFLRKEVDILILNTASPILKLQVLKYGTL